MLYVFAENLVVHYYTLTECLLGMPRMNTGRQIVTRATTRVLIH
jgi:hypothetical protein